MPRWWVLSQTPANNGQVSRNVRMISSPHSRPWRGAKTLPPACLFEPEQEDRCSRKTHTKPKTVNLCSRYSSSARLFWKPSSCFQHALRSERKFKDVFFSITIVTHVFPRWRLLIQMQISHGGHCKVSLTPLHVATPSNQSLSWDYCFQMICSLTNDVWPIL